MPKSILNSLDKTYRKFYGIWTHPMLASSNLIGKDRIFKPKYFGGLGLRKAEANNIAMQLKLLWKLLKDNSSL